MPETAMEEVADFRSEQIWQHAFKMEQYGVLQRLFLFFLVTVLHEQAFIFVYTIKF